MAIEAINKFRRCPYELGTKHVGEAEPAEDLSIASVDGVHLGDLAGVLALVRLSDAEGIDPELFKVFGCSKEGKGGLKAVVDASVSLCRRRARRPWAAQTQAPGCGFGVGVVPSVGKRVVR